ncbi:Blue-light-activated protein [Thalassovita gelatinovora]|uniref:histidine kinase n=1 Tax=Thalassovita gelatinovora TaxID=53501 RepID=A0A0P1FBL6_THAGE|nr:PAS domain S-box protein [Thalassovita gelatinovora]QIZ80086.1 PAS domain S-box protein [Thalassovita gelatinovora]CUH65512.1 Blue-light-activated protein [Thalassovita gelatinovora]SER08467.1 PAS domain S-box-containing protein [Thalassovita gelatinovora]
MDYQFAITLGYGSCLLGVGVVALMQPRDIEDLPVNRHFAYLGLFGLFQGGRGFVDAWRLVADVVPSWLNGVAVALLVVSFLSLFEFSRRSVTRPWAAADKSVPIVSKWIYLLFGLIGGMLLLSGSGQLAVVEAVARYVLGLPAAVMAALALRRAFGFAPVVSRILGGSFLLYGAFAGVFVPASPGLPGWLPTTADFLKLTGVSVSLVLTGVAGAAMISLAVLCREQTGRLIAALRAADRQGRDAEELRENPVASGSADLHESERRLQHAMNIGKLGYYIWDFEKGKNVFITEEFAALHGMTIEEYMSEIDTEEDDIALIHPDDREMYIKALSARRETPDPITLEYRIVGKDGVTRFVHEVEAAPEWRADEPTMMEGTLQDITDFKLLEQELRASEATYRGILDHLDETYYRSDKQGRITMISPSCQDLLGYSVDDLIGRPIKSLYFDSEARHHFLQALDEQGGHIRNYPAWLCHKDGQVIVGETNARFILGDNDEVLGVEGTVRNVTERMQAEEINTRLGRIIEDSVNEVYVFGGDDLHFILVNRGARENLGYSMDELKGMSPFDIKPDYSRQDFLDLIQPLRDGRVQVLEFEIRHQRKDGSFYDVQIRLQIARTETPPIYFAIVEDITERKATELQLVRAQKLEAVGQLTGGIAHDFNNLLAVIQGNAEVLEDDGIYDPRMVSQILRATERGAELTQRLLAFSRQQPLAPEEIDLSELVGGMLSLLQRTLGETIDIQSQAEEGLWPALADPGQVENALLNLAINARHAMPDGGPLTIACQNVSLPEPDGEPDSDQLVGDFVMLSVGDRGHGMSKETLARVFEPFFTTKEVGEGSGLGLSMVYGFARQSGGQVIIDSVVGEGTTVKLFLPKAEANSGRRMRVKTQDIPKGQGETVLVLEDESEVRTITGRMLRKLGYTVVMAQNTDEAQRTLAAMPGIRLILSDVVLPGGISGPEFAAQVRANSPDMQFIFMSGYPAEYLRQNRSVNADIQLLTKPFRVGQLAQAVNSVFHG